jgi:hypothetical protein
VSEVMDRRLDTAEQSALVKLLGLLDGPGE